MLYSQRNELAVVAVLQNPGMYNSALTGCLDDIVNAHILVQEFSLLIQCWVTLFAHSRLPQPSLSYLRFFSGKLSHTTTGYAQLFR